MYHVPKRVAEASYAILRIGAGLFFLLHGGQKLLGWFGGMRGTGATAEIATQMGIAGILELVGGALILIGLFTNPVAFILSGEMAVAYFTAHFSRGFWPIENQGEPAALYSLIFLFFAFNGAGRFSVDALLQRRRERFVEKELPREYELPVPAEKQKIHKRAG
ncbi:MAG: DoxX family protein [Gemmatimonadota bacterium]